MPIATPGQFREMLDAARRGGYALPAINVSTVTAINGALAGLAEARSDGILQVLPAAGAFAGGLDGEATAEGAIVLAEAAHRLAQRYDVLVALHTDHCLPEEVDAFLLPLIEETARRRAEGRGNLFNSHMFDGSQLPLEENMERAAELLRMCTNEEIILEVEAGVIGGQDESGASGDEIAGAYTTPEDMLYVDASLGGIGRYLLAPSFGNQHGSYKAGELKLRPEVLRDGQLAMRAKNGGKAQFDFVFHGGSSSPVKKIQEAIGHGVVKMNLDSDTLYAFTRPIAQHLFQNFENALRLDGEMGIKNAYDPAVYLRKGALGFAERVRQACADLKAAGLTLSQPEPERIAL